MIKDKKTAISQCEFAVLSFLGRRRSQNNGAIEEKLNALTPISEIVNTIGIRDSEEVLRALYTLEGRCLVQPEPAGDFTSHVWQITDYGVRALEVIQN